MACAAVLYLSIDEHGNWNGMDTVLTAVVAFLKVRTEKLPTIDPFAR